MAIHRSLMSAAATAIATATALGAVAVAQAGAVTHRCGAVRTDQTYHAAVRGEFGARSITARGTSCPTARRLAAAYVEDPYSVYDLRDSTKTLDGWTCTWRADRRVAQQVTVGCDRGARQIAFADLLPNG